MLKLYEIIDDLGMDYNLQSQKTIVKIHFNMGMGVR